MNRRSPLLALVAVPLAAVALAGCGGKVIDNARAEAAIKADVEKNTGVKINSVTCPSDVDVKTGATFDCTMLSKDGRTATVTLKILNENADVKVIAFKTHKK